MYSAIFTIVETWFRLVFLELSFIVTCISGPTFAEAVSHERLYHRTEMDRPSPGAIALQRSHLSAEFPGKQFRPGFIDTSHIVTF